ncbi:MAG: SIMPL domain-containing protein [Candidatus Pacebacteria bacterium]|jgi:hypothetical protein|nr:hypothetical protein [bacterium]MDP6527383.1 SIMPL domain-containing protein [Candidatus Paceibacterota bacterium]MDP6659510.1 SIMPL domain-containing protein [Candidatus Paceibacterota bacterium]|tara:strand:- start:40046 stop:40849 length:804 start_codon:yes stop_codon:yes gene_type:complete
MFNSFIDERMKKSALWALILLVVFLGAKTITEFLGWQHIGADTPVVSTISVQGEGEVFAVPDVATLTYTVSVEKAKTAKEAQDEAARVSNLALDYLKKNDIDEKDIKTTNFNLQPQYTVTPINCFTFPCPPRERVFEGFSLFHSIEVKVREIDSAGEILSGLSEAGGEGLISVGSLNFLIDDEEELQEEAREMAIDDAKDKAKALAKDLGVRLVRVVNFNEFGGGQVFRAFEEFGIGGDASTASSVPQIPTGENRISSTVSVTYEIR